MLMEGDNNECIGLDLISDLPNFDFLSSFENESNEDSPYSNLEIDCKYTWNIAIYLSMVSFPPYWNT